MCGIAGYISHLPQPEGARMVGRMSEALRARGPDGSGVWEDARKRTFLAHRRLSILDLSENGAQPMVSRSGRYVITYNGEIYNTAQLRRRVEEVQPTVWRGHSDTEVILAHIERFGLLATLTEMVGMFAFGLWDTKDGRLWLCRDRAGEKPLYYGRIGNDFAFASDLAAFAALPGEKLKISDRAIASLLERGYIPAPLSIYENIAKLSAGHWLEIDAREGLSIHTPIAYWSPATAHERAKSKASPLTWFEAAEGVAVHLSTAIEGQMLSDVPLGAFLSGGVDSSLVVALMQERGGSPVKTFTIGYEDPRLDESRYAEAIAAHLGTEHHTIMVSAKDAMAAIPDVIGAYSEPFADSSAIPTALLCRFARQSVTVALSGDGGDEVFGGYNRYLTANRLWQRARIVPSGVRQMAAAALLTLPAGWIDGLARSVGSMLGKPARFALIGDKVHKVASALAASSAQEFHARLASFNRPERLLLSKAVSGFEAPEHRDLMLRAPEDFVRWMMLQDFRDYLADDILVKVDRAAMASSLETRAPLLDHRLVEFAAGLPNDYHIAGGETKRLLRHVLSSRVPRHLIERPKMGFGIPLDEWLRGPLSGWAADTLAGARASGYFDARQLERMWSLHKSGRRNLVHHLWPILSFQSWYEQRYL